MVDFSTSVKLREVIIGKLCEACDMFGLELDPWEVDIRFDLKGRVGGYAGYKVNSFGDKEYFLRFNIEGINKHWDNMVNVVVPHEVAHIVAYAKPSLGAKNHNRAWSIIDRKLGGNGQRCHSMKLTKARKTTWYIYEVAGMRVKLSKIRHNRMLTGQKSYSYVVGNRKHRLSVDQWTGETVAA